MASQLPSDPPPRPVGHEQIGETLHTPILAFNLPAEIEHLQQKESWRAGTGPSSTTLAKHPDLRLVLVAMRKGEILPQHRTVARISVHVLRGRVQLRLPHQNAELQAGQVIILDRDLAHDVVALEESAFLLTLAWPSEEKAEKAKADAELKS